MGRAVFATTTTTNASIKVSRSVGIAFRVLRVFLELLSIEFLILFPLHHPADGIPFDWSSIRKPSGTGGIGRNETSKDWPLSSGRSYIHLDVTGYASQKPLNGHRQSYRFLSIS
jgi:hypothetical protein